MSFTKQSTFHNQKSLQCQLLHHCCPCHHPYRHQSSPHCDCHHRRFWHPQQLQLSSQAQGNEPPSSAHEQGMATVSVAVAMVAIAFISLITVQFLSLPSQLSHTQNYADLAAISAAQLIQNGEESVQICERIKRQVNLDSQLKVELIECEIDGELVHIKASYRKILPFLTRAVTADARAGPVPE